MALGGNFVSATPDTEVTAAALASCELTVQVSTKLNRSHLRHGPTGPDPAVPGPHRDRPPAQRTQVVSVEDSMGVVHASRGRLEPASRPPAQRGGDRVPAGPRRCWASSIRCRGRSSRTTTTPSATASRAVVPGFDRLQPRACAAPGGFELPHPPRDAREFPTRTGRANFTVNPLQWLPVPPGRLLLQTMRSHDQYNTTIYGLDDRYRGIKGGRRVVFVNPADIETLGLKAGQRVDLVSEWTGADGRLQERRAKDFLVVAYSTPVGNAAAYYPETNPLVPLDHTAAKSNTPVSKAITVRLEPAS